MNFDDEGHICVTPREVQALAIADPQRLIQEVLIPGTPWAFPTHALYLRFLQYFADTLNVHPRNILLRGSTKVEFSIAPTPKKVWRTFTGASDLDLAIVDQGYFDRIEEEVRIWERKADNRARMIIDQRAKRAYEKRTQHGGRYKCLRYFDLPLMQTVQQHNDCLVGAPVLACSGRERQLTAFVFRDWWGIADRYLADIEELARKMAIGLEQMPEGGDRARPEDDPYL